MIADILSNKKRNPIVAEFFIRGRKIKHFHFFITQFYSARPTHIRLNSTPYSITNIPNKEELQQILFNELSDIDFRDFIKLYMKCTVKPYSFLVIDTILASDNPLRFRKNILEEYKN